MKAINNPYLIDRLNIRRESAVYTEYASPNNCSERQIVEHICERAPNLSATIFLDAFCIKTIVLKNKKISEEGYKDRARYSG